MLTLAKRHHTCLLIALFAQVAVLGRNAEGSWLRIQTQEGLLGWVSAELVRSDAAQEVPVVTPTP
jgi:hypothetical protein